jgi:hypothetical protein
MSNVHMGIASKKQYIKSTSTCRPHIIQIVFQNYGKNCQQRKHMKNPIWIGKLLPTCQNNLLMYACLNEYNNPLELPTFGDCNEFVNKWTTKRQDFKLTHGFDPTSGK